MKLSSLSIQAYKNLKSCDVAFDKSSTMLAVIGDNGSGKSNLIEALLHILVSAFFGKSAPFTYNLCFSVHNREVRLAGDGTSLAIEVDGHEVKVARFMERLRDGEAQVYFPDVTFVYYSGECKRIKTLVGKYERQFRQLASTPEGAGFRPLFVRTSNDDADLIAVALVAHRHSDLLKRVGVIGATNLKIHLQSPEAFDPSLHEPKLWNTSGAIRRTLATLDDNSTSQRSARHQRKRDENTDSWAERRTYLYEDDEGQSGLQNLAASLSSGHDNLYLALTRLRDRNILRKVEYQLVGVGGDTFSYDELSEGTKQLLAVIGGLRLTTQREALVLLDEPDTHLNPQWRWDFAEMVTTALSGEQRPNSNVVLTTHDPVMISGLTREEVLVANSPDGSMAPLRHPIRNPRGQGIANLLCSDEFFGLPSSLDKVTQRLLDERLELSVKIDLLPGDRERLRSLNEQLEMVEPGVSERDPAFVEFLRRQRRGESA